MADVIALAERVDALTEPDRDVDSEIHLMLGYEVGIRIDEDGCAYAAAATIPRYTGSADATMSLPIDGWGVEINRYFLSSSVSEAPVWSVCFSWGLHGEHAATEDRPSLPLAYTSAWLRAKAAILSSEGDHDGKG